MRSQSKEVKRFTFQEACEHCGLAPEVLIRFVSFSWVVPDTPPESLESIVFVSLDEEDLARARLIWELQNDFGVNDEAIPLILHLIDQLNRTQLELRNRISQ